MLLNISGGAIKLLTARAHYGARAVLLYRWGLLFSFSFYLYLFLVTIFYRRGVLAK